MNDKDFQTLWNAALASEDKEQFVKESEAVLPGAKAKRQEYAGQIWDVAHMTIRELIEQAGYNQSSFARHFCIPLRTVQDWCRKPEICTPWVKLGFARQLGML